MMCKIKRQEKTLRQC